jgi:hypothetical protein
MADDLTCTRCGQPLKNPTSAVIETLQNNSVIERLHMYSLHPACAKLQIDIEAKKLARKYRQRSRRSEMEVRWACHDPGLDSGDSAAGRLRLPGNQALT